MMAKRALGSRLLRPRMPAGVAEEAKSGYKFMESKNFVKKTESEPWWKFSDGFVNLRKACH